MNGSGQSIGEKIETCFAGMQVSLVAILEVLKAILSELEKGNAKK